MSYRSALARSCLLFAPLVLSACGQGDVHDPRIQPPLVRVIAVKEMAAPSRTFTGTVAARVQSDLGFRVSGKVLERLVDAGQQVKRGQALMRLDPVDLQLAANAQAEAVVAARARAQQATEDEVRYQKLVGSGAVSVSAYKRYKAEAESARAQLSSAQAQARVAKNAIGYALLQADADGVVMETLVEPGQVINAGQVVVRVAHAGKREAVIQLPETLRPRIGSVGSARFYGTRDVRIPATLRQLSDTAESLTRTFEARYVLNGELANTLPLGTTVSIELADGAGLADSRVQKPQVWEVPLGGLLDAGKGAGVWRIQAISASNQLFTVTWCPVQILGVDDETASVTGELKSGDRVIALGAHLLHEGESVRLLTAAQGGLSHE